MRDERIDLDYQLSLDLRRAGLGHHSIEGVHTVPDTACPNQGWLAIQGTAKSESGETVFVVYSRSNGRFVDFTDPNGQSFIKEMKSQRDPAEIIADYRFARLKSEECEVRLQELASEMRAAGC